MHKVCMYMFYIHIELYTNLWYKKELSRAYK